MLLVYVKKTVPKWSVFLKESFFADRNVTNTSHTQKKTPTCFVFFPQVGFYYTWTIGRKIITFLLSIRLCFERSVTFPNQHSLCPTQHELHPADALWKRFLLKSCCWQQGWLVTENLGWHILVYSMRGSTLMIRGLFFGNWKWKRGNSTLENLSREDLRFYTLNKLFEHFTIFKKKNKILLFT